MLPLLLGLLGLFNLSLRSGRLPVHCKNQLFLLFLKQLNRRLSLTFVLFL